MSKKYSEDSEINTIYFKTENKRDINFNEFNEKDNQPENKIRKLENIQDKEIFKLSEEHKKNQFNEKRIQSNGVTDFNMNNDTYVINFNEKYILEENTEEIEEDDIFLYTYNLANRFFYNYLKFW